MPQLVEVETLAFADIPGFVIYWASDGTPCVRRVEGLETRSRRTARGPRG